MNFFEAVKVAKQFGAKVYGGHFSKEATQCWIDRVAYLPIAAESGKLVEAVLEANRYA